jgi:DNA repair protein RadA
MSKKKTKKTTKSSSAQSVLVDKKKNATFEYNNMVFTSKPESIDIFFEEMVTHKILAKSTATKIMNKLKGESISSFEALNSLNEMKLTAIDGIAEASAKKIARYTTIVATEGKPIRSFDEQIKASEDYLYLETQVTDLNNHLWDGYGRGFRSQTLNEFYGQAQSGKSQWMYDLCIRVMLPKEKGGWGRSALYLDTEGAYSPGRLMKSAYYWGLTEVEIKQKMFMISPSVISSGSDLLTQLNHLDDLIKEKDIGIIIVDSIIQPFKSEFGKVSGSGLANMGTRQHMLFESLTKLKTLARTYNLIVCYTNQVIANIGANSPLAPKYVPTGGDTVSHASDLRFHLKKAKAAEKGVETRNMKLVDCGWLPSINTNFCFTSFGMVSPTDASKAVAAENEILKIIDKELKEELKNHLDQAIPESDKLKAIVKSSANNLSFNSSSEGEDLDDDITEEIEI